ncbi:LpqB family beta-propeller domain-containing protein [Dactylosporangium sp. NPDC050588]|uniref:LpqB family beta-propeller domain-containing protein n=1 Tax=Dactylosporangium sp. NPDC050588 TaxID=3157211 RepID=UPI00340372B5
MTARFLRLTAGVAVVALVLGGCGLPDRTDPRYVGPAVEPSRVQDRADPPEKPDGATSLSDLVNRYLKTSVGGNITNSDQQDAASETQTRMKTFMTEQTAATWKPTGNLTVVAQGKSEIVQDGTRSTYKVVLTRVGQLDSFGRFTAWPTDSDRTFPAVFESEEVGGQVRFSQVPQYMLLSTAGLQDQYIRQPIYFWEKDVEKPKLVPDLRYMPKVLQPSKRVDEVVRWLVEGPSAWLTPAVDRLSGIETKGSATVNADQSVNVNLISKVAGKSPDDLRKLASQIRWSLILHPPVSLSFENARDTTNDSGGYLGDNSAVVQGDLDQERFAIVNESVRQLSTATDGPALFGPSEWNKAVVSATINRARTRAALVRKVGNKEQLFVNADTRVPTYVEVPGMTAATLSRPVWIDHPAPRFLIADGASLWAVTPPGAAGEPPVRVAVPGPNDTELTNVSAFSVSPDGRRVALVIGGKETKVAALKFENGKLTLGEQHAVPNSLGANRAVGWLTETSLVIGGEPNPANGPPEANYSLVRTSLDGTGEEPLPRKPEKPSAFPVTELSARTNDAAKSLELVLVMFQDKDQARGVYATSVDPIEVDAPGGGTPSPSATQTPKLIAKSPFYAD